MELTPTARKAALTIHVVTAVGWIGAIAAFFTLSVVALRTSDAAVVRDCYVAMDLVGRNLLVPLSLAALVGGVFLGLVTPWGLTRYYWVLVKLILTAGATVLLIVHQWKAVGEAVRRVVGSTAFPTAGELGPQLAWESGVAVLLLIIITAVSVFKPWGLTPFSSEAPANARIPGSLKAFAALIGLIALGFAVIHHASGGHHHH